MIVYSAESYNLSNRTLSRYSVVHTSPNSVDWGFSPISFVFQCRPNGSAVLYVPFIVVNLRT